MSQPQSDPRGAPPPSQPAPGGTGGYVPPPSPTYPTQAFGPPYALPPQMQPVVKSAPAMVMLGNLSLFAMAASLVFFGAFTFLGGFLLGMWFEVPAPVRYVSQREEAQAGLSQPQRMPQASEGSVSREMQGALGQSAKMAFGKATHGNIPALLHPVAAVTQAAVGHQVAHLAQTLPAALPASEPQQPSSQGAALPGGIGDYTVQLGVYAAPENATRFKEQMQALGQPAIVVEGKSQEGDALYYVQSGSYHDYATALEAVGQLAAHAPGAIVVKLPAQKASS